MMLRFFIILIGCYLLPLSLSAQATVTAELSRTSILIGDQVNLQIRVSQPGTAQVDIDLNPLAEVEGVEIVAEEEPVIKEDPGWQYLEKNITLTSFDSGEYLIPQIPIRLLEGEETDLRFTNPIPLTVATIPVATDSIQLAPIKDIDREAFSFQDSLPYLLGVAGVLIVGSLLWFFVFRKRKQEETTEPEIIRPPHEIAFEKLDQLEKEKWWQQGKVKTYYSRLTYIAREYLENRFQVPALERTTGEILQEIQGFAEIDEELQKQLRHILNASDLVKFAKAEPAATFHVEAMNQTRKFIDITQQKPMVENKEEEALNQENKTETSE